MAKLISTINDQYLRLMTQLMGINRQYELTDFEVKVLDEVCRYHIDQKYLTVSNLLKLKQLASSAKIHISMKRLIKKKMIVLKSNDDDERIRYVKPSQAALGRLNKLNQLCGHKD